MYKLLAILGLFPCFIRCRTVKTPANEIEWGSRAPGPLIWEVTPVRKHNPALEEVMPLATGIDDQPALLDRIISKVLYSQRLPQRIRGHRCKAQLILLDRFEGDAPLVLAEIEVLLRQLLVEKLHSSPEQFFKVVPLLLELLPLLLLRRIERGQWNAGATGQEVQRFDKRQSAAPA